MLNKHNQSLWVFYIFSRKTKNSKIDFFSCVYSAVTFDTFIFVSPPPVMTQNNCQPSPAKSFMLSHCGHIVLPSLTHATTHLFSHIVSSFPEGHTDSHRIRIVNTGIFHSAQCLEIHASCCLDEELIPFLFLRSIPLCVCTIVCLSIRPWFKQFQTTCFQGHTQEKTSILNVINAKKG